MKRRYRLRDSRSFARIRRSGRRRRGTDMTMCCLDNDLPHCRFGFVVSKRVGNAVTRNRVKRRLRAIFTGHLPGILIGYDIVVICRPTAARLAYRGLEEQCLRLASGLGLLASRSVPAP